MNIGSYYYLFNTSYGGNKTATNTGSLQCNLSTPLSGYFYDGFAYDQGDNGSFWSSTSYNYDTNYMRYLVVNPSNASPQSAYPRNYGYSVRYLLQ